ncbi:nuclear pore complex assembly-domain-containing protein [Sparassis latifolia]
MEVDETADGLLTLFDITLENFPWRPPVPQEIEARRVQLADVLIFDILLASGGIRHASILYPPADAHALQRLLDAIVSSTYDALKQDCLIYFLLRWHRDGREQQFMKDRCISPQFVALADAYWYLDTGIDVGKGISLLADARLNKDYTSKILQVLSLTDTPGAFIRQYVRTAKPLLTEPDDIDAYALALAESSLMEAWQYQRTFSEKTETRRQLLRGILDWCLTPRPRATPLKHLLAFPFSDYEQSSVNSYALNPPAGLPPHSVSVIQDLVCLRLVQSGQFAAAIVLDRRFSNVSGSGGVGDRSERAAHERRQMMDELMTLMPAAERLLLELELEQLAQGKGEPSLSASCSASPWTTRASDLNMSWENVRAPLAANGASISAGAKTARVDSPLPPIPRRSGAPRFGMSVPAHQAVPDDDMLPPLIPTTQAPHIPTSISAPPKPPIFHSTFAPRKSLGSTPFAGLSSQPFAAGQPFSPLQNSRGPALQARPGSLFELAGSANQKPNAFYQPPPPATGKRPFGQDAPRPAVPPPPRSAPQKAVTPTQPDEDVTMEPGEPPEHVGNGSARAGEQHADGERVSAEFSVSVFSRPLPPDTLADDEKPRPAQPELRQKSTSLMPPGAFLPDSDESESERLPTPVVPAPAPTHARRRKPEPRTPSPPSAHTRSARRGLRRSIPGALMPDDGDDEEEEEEDTVPPLPPTTARRPTRRARARSSVESVDSQDDEPPTPARLRRSSRLSAAPAHEEEEVPATPAKTRRQSTRPSTGTTPAKTARKKR